MYYPKVLNIRSWTCISQGHSFQKALGENVFWPFPVSRGCLHSFLGLGSLSSVTLGWVLFMLPSPALPLTTAREGFPHLRTHNKRRLTQTVQNNLPISRSLIKSHLYHTFCQVRKRSPVLEIRMWIFWGAIILPPIVSISTFFCPGTTERQNILMNANVPKAVIPKYRKAHP